MGIIPIVTYASVIVFVLAVVIRFVKINNMPMHLRWELYPVAHEKGRADYGGSYLEDVDWWKKKRESSLAGELKVMIPEILLLAGVWEHNRSQWLRSFPFHFGLYMLTGFIVLVIIGGIVVAAGGTVSAESNSFLYTLTNIFGYVGLVLALLGSVLLLGRRLLNEDYREYTKPSDFFNLYFFVATLAVALIAHLTVDTGFTALRAYFAQLVTFGGVSSEISFLTGLEVILASLIIAYIPLTHMSHFFTKWFMYHHIRWSDEPNMKGGPFEEKIGKLLENPVSWSAPHIRGDGKKNWVDVATSDARETKE